MFFCILFIFLSYYLGEPYWHASHSYYRIGDSLKLIWWNCVQAILFKTHFGCNIVLNFPVYGVTYRWFHYLKNCLLFFLWLRTLSNEPLQMICFVSFSLRRLTLHFWRFCSTTICPSFWTWIQAPLCILLAHLNLV